METIFVAIMETPLRKARVSAGRTLTAVAEDVGIEKGTLSKIETGKSTPSTGLAARLASYYGISEMEILYPERYVEKGRNKRSGAAA